MREKLRDAYSRFTHPHGAPRTWNPSTWRFRDRVLVIGDAIACVAAVAALVTSRNDLTIATFFASAAAVAGTLALLWYALDMITAGDMPLNPRFMSNLRGAQHIFDLEKAGVRFDTEGISGQGGVPILGIDVSQLLPELLPFLASEELDPMLAAILSRAARAAMDESGMDRREALRHAASGLSDESQGPVKEKLLSL